MELLKIIEQWLVDALDLVFGTGGKRHTGAWPVVIIAAAVLFRLAWSAWRGRQRSEFRRRTLELLALAVRHRAPLPEVLHRAAADEPGRDGRRFDRIATALESGAPLSQALAAGARECFSDHTLATIDTADDSAALLGTLERLAAATDRARVARYRWSLALGYPAMLAILLVLFHGKVAIVRVIDADATILGPSLRVVAAIAIVLTGAWAILAFGCSDARPSGWTRQWRWIMQRMPIVGQWARANATAELLDTVAAQVEVGRPLADALSDSAATVSDQRFARDVDAAARFVEAGATAREAWGRSRLPERLAIRAAAAAALPPADHAAALRRLAGDCRREFDEHNERARQRTHPILATGFGTLIALYFADFILMLQRVSEAAQQGIPW